jgi:hypothetical protein
LPLVIHNGKRPWRAPRDLRTLFVPLPHPLRRRLPRLTYHVLDQSRLDLSLPKGVRLQVEQITSVTELKKLTRKVLRATSLQDIGLG